MVEILAVESSIHAFNEADDKGMPLTDKRRSPPKISAAPFGNGGQQHETHNDRFGNLCSRYHHTYMRVDVVLLPKHRAVQKFQHLPRKRHGWLKFKLLCSPQPWTLCISAGNCVLDFGIY